MCEQEEHMRSENSLIATQCMMQVQELKSSIFHIISQSLHGLTWLALLREVSGEQPGDPQVHTLTPKSWIPLHLFQPVLRLVSLFFGKNTLT